MEKTEFVMSRTFDAPVDMVWQVWSDPDLLARWYGPGIETVIHEFQFRVGGNWLNEMRMEAMSDWSKMTFTEISPNERIAFTQSTTDENWNVTANSRMPDWPRTLLTTVSFSADGAGTSVELRWKPVNATAAEIACFQAASDKLGYGWGSGFDIIADILVELQ